MTRLGIEKDLAHCGVFFTPKRFNISAQLLSLSVFGVGVPGFEPGAS